LRVAWTRAFRFRVRRLDRARVGRDPAVTWTPLAAEEVAAGDGDAAAGGWAASMLVACVEPAALVAVTTA